MANEWLRLWHDMPTDPKWRTISRVSGQRISDVLAVYLHLLVDASRNVTRGHVTVTAEDIASAIDVTEDVVTSILEAMQGRVISDGQLTGWAARQPKREDAGNPETGAKSATERKRAQRDRERSGRSSAGSGDVKGDESVSRKKSRNVTTDKDKDKDKEVNQIQRAPRFDAQAHLISLGIPPVLAADWIKLRKGKKAEVTETAIEGVTAEAQKAGMSLDAALRECCSRGWAGFKASWLARDGADARGSPVVSLEARNKAVADKWVPPEMRAKA